MPSVLNQNLYSVEHYITYIPQVEFNVFAFKLTKRKFV
jgi:hypothetical protein